MKRAINFSLIGAFLFAIALAASPQLHDRIHGDAPHDCAVSLIASGNYEHSTPPVPIVRPVAFEQFDVVNCQAVFVRSLFIGASILEHAPPQNS